MVKLLIVISYDIGGFDVKCILLYFDKKMVGLFIFFDYMGLNYFFCGEGINVKFYFYIGLLMFIYLFMGSIYYCDLLGNSL